MGHHRRAYQFTGHKYAILRAQLEKGGGGLRNVHCLTKRGGGVLRIGLVKTEGLGK